MTTLPPWVIFHVPHDSTIIPVIDRPQFTLQDKQLKVELLKMWASAGFETRRLAPLCRQISQRALQIPAIPE